ncbi:MAG: ABC transporter ATP-binding protein [Acetobacteraceae bacterium]
MAAVDNALRIDGLTVRYGHATALDQVSLRVDPGEVVALLGANGAGKTTLLNAISGIRPAAAGAITWRGEPILARKPHRVFAAGIVQVSQGRDLFPEMSVLENLRLGAICRRGGESERLDTVFTSFPRLAERRAQRVATLSGGEQQMVAIGRAMMGTPRLLMLDEPSGGLAPRFVDEIAAIMARLKQQRATMLIVEQNIELALGIADRAYILRDGRIMGCETVANLGTDYRALAQRFYL